MSVDFIITSDEDTFRNDNSIKIKYSNDAIGVGHFTVGNCGLLFENSIREQDIRCFEWHNHTAFFQTDEADFPFDIFAAAFYLLSRYEEYLPHKNDTYGRYAHENSLAFKEQFLHLPLVNIWIINLASALQQKFTGFSILFSHFTFLPTYDIDIAFSYRHKGWLRNAGGFFKSPTISRVKVLLGLDKDPFDSYDWLNEIHSLHDLHPVYFFLLAQKNGKYDKNILPHKMVMWKLIREHAQKYTMGIHPSWQSGDQPALQTNEKMLLETISQLVVTKSRQHYIRFNLPGGYRQLTRSGITDDYSMGYGSINGFRASVASSFYWYDLEKNEPTLLRIHPFCFMDANAFYEQKLTPSEAYDELMRYFLACKEVGGQLITIWHNNFLGTDPTFAGWKAIYNQFMSQLKKESDKTSHRK